jgi:hypothetical protein
MQVSIFLGVVCSVLAEISRRFGDFLMGLVSILIKLALQFQDGQPSLMHENICSNIPTMITSALAHFKLDGRVMIYTVCPACNCTFKLQITVSLAWAYHSPTNVHIYSLVAEHIGCSIMSLLV